MSTVTEKKFTGMPLKQGFTSLIWGAGLFLFVACCELLIDHQRFSWIWAISGLLLFTAGAYFRDLLKWRRKQKRIADHSE